MCARGLALALGYNTLYAHFIKAPNDALLGTQDTVEVELLGYAEETSHGAKVTVKILNRGLPGRAIYYGDADLMDLEPGAHVTAEDVYKRQLHGRPFFLSYLYVVMRAANAVPELRRRLLSDGQVVEYDHCDPSYTCLLYTSRCV